MKMKFNRKGLRRRFTALFLSICMSAAFAPSALAEALSDSDLAPVSENASGYIQTANSGFENVESDGGTMFVGTARIPKANGTSFATVKFIYSSGVNLNGKSLKLINTELNACGVTVSGSMVYVSQSDIVSDSTLVTETSERQAVFACGSEAAPTVLKAYPAYDSVETSFEYLYRGYVYNISEYTSLSSVLSDRKEITLSEDGKSAYTSIVMAEDYVEKTINGKKVRILMINSELKYCFRAPKLVFVKDDTYNVASASDIEYHYGSTTAPSSTTEAPTTTTVPPEELIVSSDESTSTTQATTTAPDDDTSGTTDNASSETVNIWDYLTTTTEAQITAGASLDVTSPGESTTTQATTASTTQSTTKATTVVTTTTTEDDFTDNTTSPTLPTPTTREPENSAELPNATRDQSLNSRRGIVNTRRLALNVRSGPGMKYMVVTVLPKGSYVTVLDTSNPDWYMVKTMGNVVGYCYSGYIKFI